MNMFKYICKIIQHKYYVLQVGMKLNLSILRLLLHDISKFTPAEFFPYMHYFYPSTEKTPKIKEDFNIAWKLHYSRNKHHWEYWFNDGDIVDMPRECVMELVADWVAASKSYNGHWPLPRNVYFPGSGWEWFDTVGEDVLLNKMTYFTALRVLVLLYLFDYISQDSCIFIIDKLHDKHGKNVELMLYDTVINLSNVDFFNQCTNSKINKLIDIYR